MTMSRKFDMPLLSRHVLQVPHNLALGRRFNLDNMGLNILQFLLSSAAGKPIQAMRIAEEHQLADLYRESSRFLLDNWSNWDSKELDTLSSDTLLKLEKK